VVKRVVACTSVIKHGNVAYSGDAALIVVGIVSPYNFRIRAFQPSLLRH
jgi:hypothetical protein